MQNSNPLKDIQKYWVYESPSCDEIILKTEGLICNSVNTTEQLQEEEYTW